MEDLSATDLQIFREKSRAFLGSVKIPLDKLRHEELPDNPRQRDEKNVARLLGIFQSPEVGCQRRDSDNHVPVVIPRSALPERPLEVGNDFQLFNPDHPLTFLHGRHRIEAAREFLTGNDRWWIANLYSDDLSLQVKNVLREHDPSCAKFYDGDILRQILISTKQGDTARREKFLARLSKSKQDCVKRLELLAEEFLDSLDDLIPFAGLWPAMFIGTFPRLLKLHCPEEMTRYLRRVKAAMTYIIGENEKDWLLIDANTAFLLQGRCPGLSLEDRVFVQMRMLARELFPAIRDDDMRSQILERLCSIKYVITTMHTFLEDTKYLEPCTRLLKKILPGRSKGSLSKSFKALHKGGPNVKVQTTEFTFEDRIIGSHASWVSYRVLWLLTLRHFPVMDGQAPRKDIGKQNTWQPGLQSQWSVDLSTLAIDNGYKKIRRLYSDHKAADISIIEDCVRRLRPSNYYKIDHELMKRKAKLIYELIGDIAYAETVTNIPELTSDHENSRPDISDRCGRPRVSVLQADEGYLFFDPIYSTSYDTTPRRYLTSFAITRDFFHSFFGTAEDDLDRQLSFRLPRDDNNGYREESGGMQGGDAERPPANQRPSPSPEVRLPPDASGLFVGDTRTATAPFVTPPEQRLASLGGRSRSASPTRPSHRSKRRRERSTSSQHERRRRRDSDTPLVEDTSAEDTDIVPWVPTPPASAGALVKNTHTATASRSRSLDGRRKIMRRSRSPSPTRPSHRSERRRERSTSSHRERRRSQGSGTRMEDTSAEDVEIVQWVPPPSTENNHSDIIQLISPLLAPQPSAEPIFVFGQETHDRTISLQDASRVLFRRRVKTTSRFMVLSPAQKGRFRVCEANSTDTVSMVNALQLPSEVPTLALASDRGKRLKLTAPTTILEGARAQRLDTALVVSKQNAGEVIRQLEDSEELGEELPHKEPQPSLTVNEIVKRNGKPIEIVIWDEGEWKMAEKNVTYHQTEERVGYYMLRVRGVRPHDWEGTGLAVEDCFRGAQNDCPPTLYLCLPEQASSVFPIEL